MDKRAALKAVAEFRKAIEKQGIKVNRLVLFGSFATGKHHKYSDIDLVVISRDFKGMDFWARVQILGRAVSEVLQPIEATALTPEEWDREDSRIVEFAKEGEVVYGA